MTDKSKLDKLKEKRKAIYARINLMEAREKTKTRKEDTRRKILIGSYIIDKAKKENNLHEIYKAMDKYLTRDSDKKLFDLAMVEAVKE